MEYEPTIGIETHAQLLTASKMFCGCSADYVSALPNTHVCPVCLGMPGSLPVINEQAVELTVLTGLALDCQVASFSKFDRKNYSYPDLPKGYQISQYDLPLCPRGRLVLDVDGVAKSIDITRIHLEEDTGKLVHSGSASLIDFNRAGVPLMEIVTEPDFSCVAEVRAYIVELHRILCYLGVSSGNMEEGAMRFEANISLHASGSREMGTRVEIKNLNSFRAVASSLEYEIARQGSVLDQGGTVVRETRGWNEAEGATYPMRGKEFSDDYRYFPEPDLPPLTMDNERLYELKSQVPELPRSRRIRFCSEYGLSATDAGLLSATRPVADYFEEAVSLSRSEEPTAKTLANWVVGDLFHLLRETGEDITATSVTPDRLVELVGLVTQGRITGNVAKQVLQMMSSRSERPSEIVDREGLALIRDQDALSTMADQVIEEHPDAVAQFKSGKETVLRFLVGQIMKASRGKADPIRAAEVLRQRLQS
jgi:aspartyl-tRNA(Asn)/glutamyl-tRNA(Gln) amidotransferase subunit B